MKLSELLVRVSMSLPRPVPNKKMSPSGERQDRIYLLSSGLTHRRGSREDLFAKWLSGSLEDDSERIPLWTLLRGLWLFLPSVVFCLLGLTW